MVGFSTGIIAKKMGINESNVEKCPLRTGEVTTDIPYTGRPN